MTSSEETELDEAGLEALALRVGSTLRADRDGAGLRIGIAAGRFNGGITGRLMGGCLDGLARCGVDAADVIVAWAPGVFELPMVARSLITGRGVDAVICLGAVIRGDTGHYDFVAGECARGIQRVQLDHGVPVIFGVLTTDTVEQSLVRSLPDETNKGLEAGLAAVEMARLVRATERAPRAATS